ncbi:unnamed protein product [Ectocarpus sp. 4 AP-2014]
MKSNWVSTKTMLLLLVCLIPCWLSSVVLVSAASASTASWTTVWVDEFQGEDVDVDKWEFPDSTEAEKGPVNVEGGVRQEQSDNNTSATENHHRMRSSSNPHLQAYIGADEYLVMVAAAAPPPQNSRDKGNSADVVVWSGPSKPPPRGRIGTARSANFVHGRIEISAKVSSRGSSGFWLMPSDAGAAGRTPCARVAIAEIRARENNAADSSGPDITASLGFGDYEEDRWGCTSSGSWPYKGGGCTLPAEHGVDWSDGFHVYALEWEEGEFRWYVDGRQYCKKSAWFARHPDDFPAPFNKAFHLEMGVAVGGGDDVGDGDSAEEEDPSSASSRALHSPSVPPEMLVDYVRITQGPDGQWVPPLESIAADGGLQPVALDGVTSSSPRALDVIINVLAVSACVLGPYMAMTGLSRPRTNTILMGIEIGAFKAANASYLIFGSYVMAFVGAVTFGMLVGYLALHHRAMARWNTVAGLAVPALFVLIDIGMISDIGSRYVCWAIFFVLTVTFAVLVFPSEHHAKGFVVATAATGSCVLKLGLGRLLGESGEIFKILDDPLGDWCHVSRICQSLMYVMGAMFFIGLCSQRCLRPLSKDVNNGGVTTSLEKQRSALFTPPRARSPLGASSARSSAHTLTRQDTCSTSNDFEIDDCQEANAGGQRQSGGDGGDKAAGRRQGNEKKGFRKYDEDEAFILGIGGRRGRAPGAWERVSAGTRSFLQRVLRPFSSFRRHEQAPVSVTPDSPTPVPMPLTGVDSNAVVSSEGDTIELVIHSPHKRALRPHRPSGWFGSGGSGGDNSGGGGGGGGGSDHRQSMPQLCLRDGQDGGNDRGLSSPSTNDYEDALSILSVSELVTPYAEVSAAIAPAIAGAGSTNTEGARSGRLADAFSDKWGSWVQDVNSSDSNDDGSDGGRRDDGRDGSGYRLAFQDNGEENSTVAGGSGIGGGGGCRSAREFDDEALLLTPYRQNPDEDPPYSSAAAAAAAAVAAAAGAAEREHDSDSQARTRPPCSSSSSSVYEEKWLWRHRDGVRPPTSSCNSSDSAGARGPEHSSDYGPREFPPTRPPETGAAGETSSRRENEDNVDSRLETAIAVPGAGAQGQEPYGESKTGSLLEIDL